MERIISQVAELSYRIIRGWGVRNPTWRTLTMPKLSFETDGEKKMYDRGRRDSLQELFRAWFLDLKDRGAFPDDDPKKFAQWGNEVLLPEINKYRGQDDLFDLLMNI